jgi:2-dehydro-3-deoxygluconokinase
MQPVRHAVTFGEAMLRLSPTGGRRLQTPGELVAHVAGAEANVAAALAGLGIPTAWASVLPDTPLGRRAAAELAGAGVDLDLVEWVDDERLGLFFVEQGAGARPTAVWYDRRDSAFARRARWPHGALAGVRYAVLSGVTPAVSPAAAHAAAELAREAGETGTRLVVDVNHRARLWDAAAARAALEPLLAAADVVVCSAADARTVFALDPDPAALRARVAPSASLCVVTRSAAGAEAVDAAGERYATPALETRIVDRLGLGDAFLAGLLCGLLDEAGPAEALRRGAALAALKATVPGDLALVSRAELDAALAHDAATVLR